MKEDRRSRFRCATSEEAKVVIRNGRREIPGRLVDQSADGFAVAVESIRLKTGHKLLLRTHRGWSEVEVVRIAQQDEDTILGLKTLRDLPDPRDRVRNSIALFTSSSAPGTRVGPILLMGILGVLGFWAYLLLAAYQTGR